MPRYSYLPFRNEGDSIRLFRLLPNEDDNAIILGELVEYNLQTSRAEQRMRTMRYRMCGEVMRSTRLYWLAMTIWM
jgi:hypothetical protein